MDLSYAYRTSVILTVVLNLSFTVLISKLEESVTFMNLPTYWKKEQEQLYLPLNILQKEKIVISMINNLGSGCLK